ncbi:MAG: hypothetical protein BJ554DRAFT_150 [Olpidium bornovanus]|uniref:Uncharacterized protein n=1 Tax=Olpidium bornovanus TaxID=278681 RepID=A0A8H7ZUA5_9FUNG|nr:MAG: hypothetical protein BJ554DRAFT_150 [Olpidium bornovanus]
MQPWRSASQVKEKEPAKAAARRPKQRGKREPTSGNRPSAPSSVVAPPSPESASLLLARVETMLREESARRTDDRGFFHLRPILSRHSSAPSFSMRKALGMLPGDQTWAAAEDRLARARYSAMPPKWVAAERKREAEINAGVVTSAGGTHGPRLPPLFPSRIPRWRSAPGKVGFPSKERTERIGVSPFHIPPARRQKEGEPGPVKQREALLGLREGDFGELDESLGAFLLAERLCLHDHLSPDDVVRVLNDDIGRRRSTVVQSLGQVQVRPSSTFLERASPTVQASPSEDHLHRHLQSNFQLALRHYRGPREGSTGSARARRKSSAQEGRSPTPVKPNPSHGIAARERRRAVQPAEGKNQPTSNARATPDRDPRPRSCRSARPGAAGSTGERMPKSRARGHDGTSAGKSPDAGPFEKRSPQHVPAPPSTVPPPRQRRRASRADADSAAASGHVRQADAAPPLQTPDVQTASRPWHGGRADDRGALDVSIAAAEEVLEATINSLSEQLRARGIERELLSQASPTRAYQTAPQVKYLPGPRFGVCRARCSSALPLADAPPTRQRVTRRLGFACSPRDQPGGVRRVEGAASEVITIVIRKRGDCR